MDNMEGRRLTLYKSVFGDPSLVNDRAGEKVRKSKAKKKP